MSSHGRRAIFAGLLFTFVSVLYLQTAVANGHGGNGRRGGFRLTVLHNNDGESQLIDAGAGLEDFGGIARFATVVDDLRDEARSQRGRHGRSGVVTLSSGDNFLAGPEWNASLENGFPYYDSIGLALIGYDAITFGNHEFDFNPDVTADFIEGFEPFDRTPFISANLRFRDETELRRLEWRGRIAKSVIVNERGEKIGIIGATTEDLAFISTPRDVIVREVVESVKREIRRLKHRRVDIIILSSHLQSIEEELELISQLEDVDIVIAGGGDELLGDENTLTVPGDDEFYGPYPLLATDADGKTVPVVTTPGSYKYVGRLVVEFDRHGRLEEVDPSSGLVRVAGGDQPDAVEPNPLIQSLVVDPVVEAVEELASTILADSEVALEGRRPDIRIRETNEGNLVADALLYTASELAGDFGAPVPDVALQNGGGIRNDSLIPAGPISALTTFDILPFSNFVTVVPDVARSQFKEILENAVSQVENVSGRFAQVAGVEFTYSLAGTPQELDGDGNVVVPGTRIVDVTLAGGEVIVSGGAVVDGAPIHVATIDFLARGGDQYPFRGAPFTVLGASYQQALASYVVDGLGGLVTAADYPLGGEGRIVELP